MVVMERKESDARREMRGVRCEEEIEINLLGATQATHRLTPARPFRTKSVVSLAPSGGNG
jgi:hypothetical protein